MDYPQTATTVLASASGSGGGPDTAGTVVLGFVFVLVVLALLAAVTALIGAFFTRQAAREAAQAARAAGEAAEKAASAAESGAPKAPAGADSATTAPAPAPEPPVAEDPQLLAVVAAAVHSVFGERPHRIVSVRQSRTGWAQEGRRQIFSSHRVR